MSRRATSIAAGAVLLMSLLSPAWAHDHEPPLSVLTVQKAEQKGRLGTYCWTAPGDQPDTYTQTCVDSIPTWPKAITADPRKQTRVRFHSATEPEDLTIAFWRHVDENKFPTGDAHTLKTTLEPVLDENQEVIAWDLVFRLPARGRHLYLRAAGYWPDQDGSGANQDASWTYHVKLS
jgi:hypothetical protein